MAQGEVKASLLAALREMEIVDCHEHLSPEEDRVAEPVDVMNLFSHYTHLDLNTAGMAEEDYRKLRDRGYPLEYRWALLRPYLEQIRYGAYARAAWIAARELYGLEDISDSTYQALSAAMADRNRPGIYHWILREKCRIRCSLTQCGSTAVHGDLLVPLMPAGELVDLPDWETAQRRAAAAGTAVNTLDDYLALMEATVARWKQEGAVGIKSWALPRPEADRQSALAQFEEVRAGRGERLAETGPLGVYLHERLLELAAHHELVVAVHAGMWGDFRRLDAKHMIPLFMRHSRTRFDLYHLSFPSVHDAVIIGKNFGNVYLNLCWTHVMSPTLACEGMRELLDFVPVNKVLGFGGDYCAHSVDKVIGHLRMMQENLATVLAERIEQGLMTEAQALTVARQWLWENPRQAYRLEL